MGGQQNNQQAIQEAIAVRQQHSAHADLAEDAELLPARQAHSPVQPRLQLPAHVHTQPVQAPVEQTQIPHSIRAALHPAQSPQPLAASTPLGWHQRGLSKLPDDVDRDSANSTVGPLRGCVAIPKLQGLPTLPSTIEEWCVQPAGTAPVPGGVGAANHAVHSMTANSPGGHRIAHTALLQFGSALPLSRRARNSATKAHNVRARDLSDKDKPLEHAPAAVAELTGHGTGKEAPALNGMAKIARAGSDGAAHKHAPPGSPCASSDTAARLVLELER